MRPLVELRSISKAWPGTLALDRVDLELRAGEIRALLGENGAGKSTLTGVLFGHVAPDAGQILVGGEPVEIDSPARAIELGIGLVHQHFALAPNLTVAENVTLRRARGPRRLDLDAAVAITRELAARTGLAVDPLARTGDLPVGLRQRVEILKVLGRDAKVLLLDEPTAVLAPPEVDELFSVLERLRGEGRAILLITHKLREVARVAQRVTVLRRGRIAAADLDARATPPEELAALVLGGATAASLLDPRPPTEKARVEEKAAPAALVLENVTAGFLRGSSLEVRPGELVGIAGIAGNGQDELFELASGLRAPESGTVRLLGERVERPDPGEFARRGVAAIPGDRHALALAAAHSCAENLALKDVAARGRFVSKLGLLDRGAIDAHARALLETHDVRPREPARLAGTLSGGNQQKLVLARELSATPSLVIAYDPARGLDVAAAAQVARELEAARARGAAVLLISTDLDEVLAVATRALALHAGRILAARTPKPDRDELGLLVLGGHA